MDVAVVTTYSDPFAARDLRLGELLARDGIRVRFARVLGRDRITAASDGDGAVLLPRDEDTVGGHGARSRAFVAWLHEVRPAWVLARGTKVDLLHDLPRTTGLRRGVIVGGGHRDPRMAALDLALVESRAQRRWVRRAAPLVPVALLPKLVTPAFFAAARSDRDVDVAGVGFQDANKDYAALVPLFGAVGSIRLVGGGPEHARLAAAAAGLPGVSVRERVAPDEVADLLGRTRILAHPAHREGLPRAVCEAMAAGCVPVLRVGAATGDMLGPHNSVTCADAAELRGRILELLRDGEGLAALSRAARRTAEAEFTDAALEHAARTVARMLAAGRARRLWAGWRDDRRRPAAKGDRAGPRAGDG